LLTGYSQQITNMQMKRPYPWMVTLSLAGGLAALPASAIEPIPETSGWRGFVLGGAGYLEFETNLVAGNTIVDIGNTTIGSVNDAPESDSASLPVITGEVSYTFGNRSQVFFGTALEDAVTLDAVTQLGMRKDLGSGGAVQAGILFSGLPGEVWEDPYAEGVERDPTDRDSSGLRFQWDRIMGSAFEFTLSYRDISIDTERSGEGVQSVACDADCQSLLVRDGDQYTIDVSYLFRLGEGQRPRHLVRPMLRYRIEDRDGDAIAGDGYRLQLSYIYLGDGFTLASNAAFGAQSYDEANPIYGVKTDSDLFAVDTTLFYRLPTESGRWQLVGNLLWGEDDSDVDFHDNQVFMVSLGAMYRFGQR
jgi:hypothetical protein